MKKVNVDKFEEFFDDIAFEGFVNVLAKPRAPLYVQFMDSFGEENCILNGHQPRTRHEINSGLKSVEKRNIKIDAEVINLPYTVLNGRKKPAITAFTTRNPEQRKIYLVPEHTPTRILNDKAFHQEAFDFHFSQSKLNKVTYELFMHQMEKLDVGERVAASIIHEYGHILTYNAFDQLGIHKPTEVYSYLDETGYLDNCAKRIVDFTTMDARLKLNHALEQIAEDYRVSHDIYNGLGLSPLPHGLTFIQDAINNDDFIEGVDIMTNVLLLDQKKTISKSAGPSALDYIIPFGEANRTVLSTRYTEGHLAPLTKEIKEKDFKELEELEERFEF